MLTTLMLSFGVPLLLGGDEMGRTQDCNNNAYRQDNEMTWFDWANADTALLDFTKNRSRSGAHLVFPAAASSSVPKPPSCSGPPPGARR